MGKRKKGKQQPLKRNPPLPKQHLLDCPLIVLIVANENSDDIDKTDNHHDIFDTQNRLSGLQVHFVA